MQLWIQWWTIVKQFRTCFSRQTTFMWFVIVLMGISTRTDLAGVSSIMRSLGLKDICYDRLLDFFHSTAIKTKLISQKLLQIIIQKNLAYKINNRPILLTDGLKVPKEGKKMPGVKSQYQSSESNSKAEYIMGQSMQAISILIFACSYFFATPLICEIHEGVVESNRCTKTLLDKMILMLDSLRVPSGIYLVADAHYSKGKVISQLLERGHHLISRVQNNAVAYLPENSQANQKRRGRPKMYGDKIKLRDVFKQKKFMAEAKADLYDEKNSTFLYRSKE